MKLNKNDFKEFIKCIRSNENLGYLYTEKEVFNAFMLSVTELKDKSVNHFNFKSNSGYDIATLTYDFDNKEIVTIHIILDYVNKFILDNIGKSVLETDLTKYNIKTEQLIANCLRYDIIEIFDNRVMILYYKELGGLSIILEG